MYVYITTNTKRNVFYTGVTNDLKRRIREHEANRGQFKTFAGRYFRFKLVSYEEFDSPLRAIHREKEIKKLTRLEKLKLIKSKNPGMNFYRV